MKRRAFTLIELLVAAALTTVLMAAVLVVLAGVSRDRKRLTKAESSPRLEPIVERLRWDLTNAATMRQSPDGKILELVGHGGIDPDTLTPTGRLTRVVYRCARDARSTPHLTREQDYLDDPVRPRHWRELLAVGVTSLLTSPASAAVPVDAADEIDSTAASSSRGVELQMPSRVRLRLGMTSMTIDRELNIK